jgi:hypothetical protein
LLPNFAEFFTKTCILGSVRHLPDRHPCATREVGGESQEADMIGSDAGKQKLQRTSKSQACIAGLGLLALGFLVTPVTCAGAQALGGVWDPDYVGGPPPIPPRDVYTGRPTAWAAPPPPPGYYNGNNAYPPAPYSRNAPVPYNNASPSPYASQMPTPLRVSIADMRRKASAIGLHLVGTPHRQGRVYIAFAEDSHGLLHHLTFDAYEGTLTENETSTVTAKPVAHPASLNTGTVNPAPSNQEVQHPAPNSQSSGAAQQASQKPASPSSDQSDQDLSPIKPKPGVKPPLPDDQIDKD